MYKKRKLPILLLIMIYSGTLVLVINSFRNSWWVPKPESTQQWSIFSCGAVWLIQALASVMSPKQAPGAETFFSHQNANEYKAWQIPKLTSTEVWLYTYLGLLSKLGKPLKFFHMWTVIFGRNFCRQVLTAYISNPVSPPQLTYFWGWGP